MHQPVTPMEDLTRQPSDTATPRQGHVLTPAQVRACAGGFPRSTGCLEGLPLIPRSWPWDTQQELSVLCF